VRANRTVCFIGNESAAGIVVVPNTIVESAIDG